MELEAQAAETACWAPVSDAVPTECQALMSNAMPVEYQAPVPTLCLPREEVLLCLPLSRSTDLTGKTERGGKSYLKSEPYCNANPLATDGTPSAAYE